MSSTMKKACLLVALVSGVLLVGCELIVDFDRTKIVGEEVPETGTPDVAIPDGTATDGTTTTDAADGGGTDAADAADDQNNIQDAAEAG